MAEPKLTYGLDENVTLIHVNDVIQGKACKCVCPHCGAELVARQGNKKQWHFAHANGADCKGARMTALHMLAQEIIKEEKKIRTPRYEDAYYTKESKIITFDKVQLEEQVTTGNINRRPDCIGILNGNALWIEIKVTHEVDAAKVQDIKNENVICMEIDLSDMLAEDYSKESITKRLVESSKNRNWINYPQLFKLNAEAREAKAKQERDEKQKELDRLARERTKLEEIINAWLKFGTKENATQIIQLIKDDPYNKQNNSITILESLIPHNNFISWIKRSPKNLYGLELFYIIAKFYSKQIATIEIKDVDNELKKYRFKDSIDEIEQVTLEELVSLRVICRLRRTYERYIDYCVDNIKELYKKYSTNVDFRNLCLKILSIEYGHIIGSKSTNFRELTEEIYNTSPDILSMYLTALEYRHKTKWPKKNIPSLDDDMIIKCKDFVASHTIEENQECKGLLHHAFEYIFKESVNTSKTNVEIEEQKDEDISFNGQMSFEEIVEGFAKMGEELNKQQF